MPRADVDQMIDEMEQRIKREEDRLQDLQDQLALCEDGDHEYNEMISDQEDYLGGLYEGFNRMCIRHGRR